MIESEETKSHFDTTQEIFGESKNDYDPTDISGSRYWKYRCDIVAVIIIMSLALFPMLGFMVIIGDFILVASLFGLEYKRLNSLKKSIMFKEIVSHDDKYWTERVSVQSIEIIEPDSELVAEPRKGQWYYYAVHDKKGLASFYITSVPLDKLQSTRTFATVEASGYVMSTRIIGSRLDPETQRVIPIKQVIMPADPYAGGWEIDYATLDMQVAARKAEQRGDQTFADAFTIKTMRDRVLKGFTDMVGIRKDKDKEIVGIYDRPSYALGWAKVSILPQSSQAIEEPIIEEELVAEYQFVCYHCDAGLEDIDRIIEHPVHGHHFICEYCGRINRVVMNK